jgi:F0F1-type ATP synthase membrane subunit b/b'
MLANKLKEESGAEIDKEESLMLEELRSNMDRLAGLLEDEIDPDFDDEFNEDIYDKEKILH